MPHLSQFNRLKDGTKAPIPRLKTMGGGGGRPRVHYGLKTSRYWVRIYKFVRIYQIHFYLILPNSVSTIILPNPKQYLQDMGLPSAPEEADSSLGTKTESRGKKAQQKICRSFSSEAPGTWRTGSATHVQHRKKVWNGT